MFKLFKKGPPKPLIESNIGSLVHEGTDYFAQELILVNEVLTANLYCAEETLIEHAGIVTGNIISKTCTIVGKLNGNIAATEHAIIKSNAIINGNINAAILDIEPGAVINGKIKIATDIYAMVNLAETLKKHLGTEQLPPKLNIAADAVAMSSKTDEPVKAPAQKANVAKPTAAPLSPASKQAVPEAVTTPPVKKQVVAAASPSQKAEPETDANVPAPKPTVAAAAPQPKKPSDEEANGRWW